MGGGRDSASWGGGESEDVGTVRGEGGASLSSESESGPRPCPMIKRSGLECPVGRVRVISRRGGGLKRCAVE